MTIDQTSWTSLRVAGGAITHVHRLERRQQAVSRMILFTKSTQGPGFQSYRITASQGIHAKLMRTQTRVHRYTECFVRWFSILVFVYNCCFVVGDVGAV